MMAAAAKFRDDVLGHADDRRQLAAILSRANQVRHRAHMTGADLLIPMPLRGISLCRPMD